MSEFAKKGKKTAAPEAPRFGRVRANLKVEFCSAKTCLSYVFE